MKAMLLDHPGAALRLVDMPLPEPGPGCVQIRVEACGVCRTDLHLIDGELPNAIYPMIPGHEIIGRVSRIADDVIGFKVGQRVGVPWLGSTCGECSYCRSGRENLCDSARFTGCQIFGGYAEYTVANARYCFPLPQSPDASQLAPLMCAGLIGYRALQLAGKAHVVGLYGFGAAAHILAQVLGHQGRDFIAFTRPGDMASQNFAYHLGALWAGDSNMQPPMKIGAAIIFAPEGSLVPLALGHVEKGGRIVCAGIHMSDIPAFPYAALWGERSIGSVANLTREDGTEFLSLAASIPIHTSVQRFELQDANVAIEKLRHGEIQGAAVLVTGAISPV
ncbi:MAG TPA: zinc-dependent alcohol dehydrogenase family protein [Rhodocyclaceae bacterium]|nr:zinc-dependent alcohol dehydrogenase family protein [Rhodocyclaceae bacterium]